MIEAYLRPNYQRYFMDPIARVLKRVHVVTPNGITLASMVTGLLAAVLFLFSHKWAALVMLLLSGLFDTLDGTLARVRHSSSDFGSALDIAGDRLVEFAIMLALFLVDPARNGLGVFMMLGASYLCVTTFLVAGIFNRHVTDKSFYYSPGLMERCEAFIFFAVMMLLPATIAWLAWLYVGLVLYTAVVRLLEFRKSSN